MNRVAARFAAGIFAYVVVWRDGPRSLRRMAGGTYDYTLEAFFDHDCIGVEYGFSMGDGLSVSLGIAYGFVFAGSAGSSVEWKRDDAALSLAVPACGWLWVGSRERLRRFSSMRPCLAPSMLVFPWGMAYESVAIAHGLSSEAKLFLMLGGAGTPVLPSEGVRMICRGLKDRRIV